MPLPNWGSRRPGFFGLDDFAYDAEADTDRCPAGHLLRRDTANYAKQVVVYRDDAAVCNACPVKSACTDSDHGRIGHRSFHAAHPEQVRAYHEIEDVAKAMHTRQVWAEPLSAGAKEWHGCRRFRLRGWEKVTGEGLLIAAGQNLKRFLAAAGWGRRHAPGGSLVARPAWSPPVAVLR